MATAIKTSKWLQFLLADVKYNTIARYPVLLNVDNQGAYAWAKTPVDRSWSKHIDVKYYWIRELTVQQLIEIP